MLPRRRRWLARWGFSVLKTNFDAGDAWEVGVGGIGIADERVGDALMRTVLALLSVGGFDDGGVMFLCGKKAALSLVSWETVETRLRRRW
jgi:hypothetical protein